MNTQQLFKNFQSWTRTRTGIITLVLFAVTVFISIVEHLGHVVELLPFILLFLCPLLHLFMHAGHGKHNSNSMKDDGSGTMQNHEGHS